MSTYTLSGAGTQSLSSGVQRLLVTCTAFGSGFSTGLAVPTNYYHLGEFRLGAGGFFFPTVPLDAAQQVINVPAGVDSLGFAMKNSQTITVVEVFSVPGTNWQKQPWDRNPTPVNEMYLAQLAPGGGAPVVWTLTVPANRLLRVVAMRCAMKRSTVATALGGDYAVIQIAAQNWVYAYLNTNVVGDFSGDDMQGGAMDFPSGTVITGAVSNGDAGGTILTLVALNGYTYDA